MRLHLAFALCVGLAAIPALAQGQGQAPARDGDNPPVGKILPNPHIVSPVASPDHDKTPDAPMLPYHLVTRPPLPNGIRTTLVSAVALMPNGHVVFLTRNPAAMMLEFDANDQFLRTFNPDIAIGPHGLRADAQGNIWLTDSFLNVVWKLNSKGEPLRMFGNRGDVKPWDDSKWNGDFNQPTDLAIDKDGNFYVVQGHGGTSNPLECVYCMTYAKANPNPVEGSDPRIMKFDPDGNLLTSRALPHADGTYPTIHSVIVTPKGEVWVADRQMRTIKVFDTSLNPIREMTLPRLVSGLFVDAQGQVWMSAGMDGRVMKLDNDGKVLGWLGEPGHSHDPLSPLIGEAHFMAVSPDEKTIYLADSVNGKMLEWKHN